MVLYVALAAAPALAAEPVISGTFGSTAIASAAPKIDIGYDGKATLKLTDKPGSGPCSSLLSGVNAMVELDAVPAAPGAVALPAAWYTLSQEGVGTAYVGKEANLKLVVTKVDTTEEKHDYCSTVAKLSGTLELTIPANASSGGPAVTLKGEFAGMPVIKF